MKGLRNSMVRAAFEKVQFYVTWSLPSPIYPVSLDVPFHRSRHTMTDQIRTGIFHQLTTAEIE